MLVSVVGIFNFFSLFLVGSCFGLLKFILDHQQTSFPTVWVFFFFKFMNRERLTTFLGPDIVRKYILWFIFFSFACANCYWNCQMIKSILLYLSGAHIYASQFNGVCVIVLLNMAAVKHIMISLIVIIHGNFPQSLSVRYSMTKNNLRYVYIWKY